VSGYRAFAIDGTAPTLAGVTVTSPTVVHISLDSPWSLLPVALASPVFSIVPREAVDAPAPPFAESPTGSGPFALESRTAERLLLTRAPGSASYLDKVAISLFSTVNAAYQAFTAGDVDWSRVPPEDVETAASSYSRDGFQPYVAALYFAFNMKSPTFADPRFRQAIVKAVDRRAIAVGVYQSTVLPLNGPVTKGMPGQVEDPCGDRCVHDVEKARQLVAAAFPSGTPVPTVNIDYDEDPTGQKVAEVIKANLAEAGIPAALRPKPAAAYPEFAAGPDKQLFRLAWIAPYPAADAVLPQLFASGSPFNLEGYSSPTVDAVLGAARADTDRARRLGRYQDAERKIMADLPVLPIAQFLIHSVAGPSVRDLKLTPAGTFDAGKVWIDKN
jgi:ABC-type transport system substrate-binding protein